MLFKNTFVLDACVYIYNYESEKETDFGPSGNVQFVCNNNNAFAK